MANWHKTHIPTQWGIAIIGWLLVSVILLIPVLGQNQDVRSHASTPSPAVGVGAKCYTPHGTGSCKDIRSQVCGGGRYYKGYCPGASYVQCCVVKNIPPTVPPTPITVHPTIPPTPTTVHRGGPRFL